MWFFQIYFRLKIMTSNFIILANDQENTEEHIEKLPKVIDCDKVSYCQDFIGGTHIIRVN